MLLPLDSPVWRDLSACYNPAQAHRLLCRIVQTRSLGEAWTEFRDEILHQGTVYGMTSAALPHLIRLAPSLTRDEQRELWIEIAYLVFSGAGSWDGREPVPGLQETLTRSLREAQSLALQAFLADDSELDPAEAGYYALACVLLAGHPVGDDLDRFLSPNRVTYRWSARSAGPNMRSTASATRTGRLVPHRLCRSSRRSTVQSGR